MICCLNGKFLDDKKATISALDNGFLYGDAFFDTMKSHDGVILELENHIQRIEKTAKTLQLQIPKNEQLSLWLQKTAKINKINESRIRITISRGPNGLNFSTSENPTILITCEPLIKDEKIAKNGISIITLKFQRPWPEIKSNNLITSIRGRKEILRQKAHDAVLIDDLGYVRECFTANIFLVKNNKILTPRSKVLPGVTRDRIIKLAKSLKLNVQMKDFKKLQLFQADEVFLSNSLRGIMPVIKIDNKKICTGKVGDIAKKLTIAYQQFVKEYTNASKNP